MIVYFPITYEKMFTPFNICGCKYFSTNRHSSYGVNNNYSLIFSAVCVLRNSYALLSFTRATTFSSVGN